MNMQISIPQAMCQTMSTLEVTSLTGKQHSHVIRDAKATIEQIKDDPNLDDPYFQIIQDSRGYISEILMDRNLTLCLVSGYSVSLRMAIINRWDELEKQTAQPMDLNNPEFLRRALLGYTERVIELEHKVEKLEPKAQALDVIADTTNTYSIRESAKTIGVQESKLIDLLLAKNWCYRENSRHRRLCAYAHRVDQKVMINKVSKVVACDDGDKVFTQARITAFGLTRLTALAKKVGLIA